MRLTKCMRSQRLPEPIAPPAGSPAARPLGGMSDMRRRRRTGRSRLNPVPGCMGMAAVVETCLAPAS